MKKLAIDIGNTFIKCGVFENNKIVDRVSIKSAKELAGLLTKHSPSQAVICSVVPQKNKEFVDYLKKHTEASIQNIHYKKTNLKLNVEKPESVGNDRLCNVFGALKLYSAPLIVIDFGTATTYDVVNKKNEFIGGIIAPGVETSTKNLISKAALLKSIDLVFPSRVIGNNTTNNIQSGIMFGAVAQVEGLVKKIQLESNVQHTLILTGGFAKLISPHLNINHVLENDLTLKGMLYINESLDK